MLDTALPSSSVSVSSTIDRLARRCIGYERENPEEGPEGEEDALLGGRLGDELFMIGEVELGVPNEKLGEGNGPGMSAGNSRDGTPYRAWGLLKAEGGLPEFWS